MGEIIKLHKLTLAEVRNRTGMTLKHCADCLEVCPETLRKWEKGITHPTIDDAKRICAFFQINIDSVLW